MFALLLALDLVLRSPLASGEPFADLKFEAALEKAVKEKKTLILDFTAGWCTPCQKMEKETWSVDEVRAWLGENTIAIQVDVDLQRELANRFRIGGIPTVVAMREGAEFDRFTGFRDAERFLGWAKDVHVGRRASDALRERSKTMHDSQDVAARFQMARELLRAKQYEEALVHFQWLWPATAKADDFADTRLTYLLKDMAELSKKHEPAKQAFDVLESELRARVEASTPPAAQAWKEWKAYCDYFGENDRIVAWYEKHRDAQGGLAAGDGADATAMLADLFDALVERKRPADAVKLWADPAGRATQLVEAFRARASAGDPSTKDVTEDVARLSAALLAAGRAPEAAAVADVLLKTIDTPEARLELVQMGMSVVKKPDPAFTRWLDEAEKGGGNVKAMRRRLERLEKKASEAKPSGTSG